VTGAGIARDRELWYPADRLAELLPPAAAILAVGAALHARRAAATPDPVRQRLESGHTTLLTMPAAASWGLGVKVLTLTEGNRERGRATIEGVMLCFDGDDGRLIGILDGARLTALRTAAVAGWATDRLASPGAHHLVVAGAGAQALAQVDAVCAVRPITRVTCWNRTSERAGLLADQVRRGHPAISVLVADDLREAVATADVVTLVTASRTPLLERRDLPERCHLNAMGAHQPDARELGSDVIAAAAVFADTVEGCLMEAGDLLIPIAEGLLTRDQVHELADAGPAAAGFTVMKSVGTASFDLACARSVLERAGS